jgi:eukaryotic-like serine/threonine-protein kinase
MAPEQLDGRNADTRTDIFAFGAVFYEMLTRRKVLHGKTQVSLISAILKDAPTDHREPPTHTAARDHAVI